MESFNINGMLAQSCAELKVGVLISRRALDKASMGCCAWLHFGKQVVIKYEGGTLTHAMLYEDRGVKIKYQYEKRLISLGLQEL